MDMITKHCSIEKKLVLVAIFAAWCCLLFYFLIARPLWLDELIHAQVSTTPFEDYFGEVAKSPGATPVTYLPQVLLFGIVGYSPAIGRLPAFLAFVAAAVILWRVMAARGMVAAIAGVGFFISLPLVSRYAIELRPYSLLLLFAISLHVIYHKIIGHHSILWTFLYVAASMAAVLTLPIALAIPLSHLGVQIVLYTRRSTGHPPAPILSRQLTPLIAISMSVLCLLPWYRYVSEVWATSIVGFGATDQLSLHVLLLISREITGAGYIGFAMLLGFAIISLFSNRLTFSNKIWLFRHFSGRMSGGFAPATPGFIAFLPIPSC